MTAPTSPHHPTRQAYSSAPPELVRNVLPIVSRRERLCRDRHVRRCPKCHTRQVQLTDWVAVPARWRCRECRHKFIHEPLVIA